jgi:hypothetical protein
MRETRREMAIRMALGAAAGTVRTMVLRQGFGHRLTSRRDKYRQVLLHWRTTAVSGKFS